VQAVTAIIERAYRGSLDEQFAGVLFLVRGMLAQLGPSLTIVLRALSVAYAVPRADGGLRICDMEVDALPDQAADLSVLLDQGAEVLVVREDCNRLGIDQRRLMPGVGLIAMADIPALLEETEKIWFL
jgi:hypothetical protein